VAKSANQPYSEGATADAVCVFATLRKRGEEDTTLLVRQFRPPMGVGLLALFTTSFCVQKHRLMTAITASVVCKQPI
jgi:hypothetical protein